MKTRIVRIRICFSAVLCCAFACLLRGQISDANLTGTILDGSGAVIAGASVEVTNSATAVRHASISDSAGNYRFPNLPAGQYAVTVAATGFRAKTVQGVSLELNRNHTLNVTVQLAPVTTSIEVTGAPAVIDTTTASVQTTFDSRMAARLPFTSDGTLGVLNLSLLSAGVSSPGGIGYGTGPSVGGQRPTNNNFMIEGVDNNNRAVTGPVINLSNEVIAEFTLGQNQLSPEFGHSSGGQFNTTIKSGTNELHGSLYEYFQNRNLNGVDQAYARQDVLTNPRYDQNRFGGTLGGPIVKGKLFYFGGLEYQPVGLAATSPGAVFAPTAEGLRALDGTPGLSRTNLDMFKRYVPVAATRDMDISVLGRTVPVGMLQILGPSYTNHLRPVVSADYNVSERDQLRARWTGYRSSSIETGVTLPAFYTPIEIRNQLASLAHLHSFSPALTNELRLGYNRRVEDHPIGSETFPGLDAFPNLIFDDLNLTVGPHQAYPQSNRSGLYQASDNVNWTAGRHTLKFGYDVRKLNATNFFVQRQRGEYEYGSLERYLRDITPEWAERSVGGFPFVGNLVSHYAFANDEFRLRPNLTLSFGLRYEYVGVPAGAQQQALNAISDVPGVIEFRSPTASKRDFAPRIGIAWSPGASGRTSIRAGFGTSYDQSYHNLGMNSLPPQFFTTVDAHVDRPDEPDFLAKGGILPAAAPVTDVATARFNTSAWIPDQQRPYSVQWNAGVQHVFARDYTLEVRYLGTRGIHLPVQVQINRQAGVTSPAQSLPTYLSLPSQAELDGLQLTLNDLHATNTLGEYGFARGITSFKPVGNSTYNGLATQLTRRYSNGLQFVLAHTWSHNIDDATATVASTLLTPRRPQDFFNLAAERADSALDHRQRFTAGWVYEVARLRNLTFSGTYMAETGTWATVRSGIDSNLNGDPAADRAVINPAGVAGLSSTVTPLTNSSGQVVAYLADNPAARYIQAGKGVFPNAARNTLRLPGINNFDLTVSKRFAWRERASLELRAEAYNAFNHAQYVPGFANSANLRARVDGGSNALLLTGSPMFNRPDLAFESNSRMMQLVVRLQF